MNENLTWHEQIITKEQQRTQQGHKSFILWFTGLSGSGKSTIANAVAKALFDMKIKQYLLDGDNIRHGLNKDLGFSNHDRKENIRRIGEVAKLFVDSGTIISTAFISPFIKDREMVRHLVEPGEFIEIYVQCDLDICEKRDPKGLYKKARKGEILDFTGISSPYEEPIHPEITLVSHQQTIQECVEVILTFLKKNNYI